ncbi:hypothetical protein P8452_68516 [Trifolium repens]|nr:hypothetical protein P8452_68516 [Trifolium repens]
MTFSASKFYTIFIFFYLAILLISTCDVERRLCGTLCKTWSDPCIINAACNEECRESESKRYLHFEIMNSSLSKFYTIFMFLCFVLLISTCGVEAKLCEKLSKTWSGPCIINSPCNEMCRKLEYAKFGNCFLLWTSTKMLSKKKNWAYNVWGLISAF